MKFPRYCILGAIWLTAFAPSVSAVTYNITPSDDWVSIFNNPNYLKPGDELVLGAGVYTASTSLHMGYRGTAENPITVRAADGAKVVITYPTPLQNVINLEGAQYLTIKGLEITGGSIGVRIGEKNGYEAKYITLDGNYIHNTAAGAVTANNTNQTYEGMHFLNNEIHDTGAVGDAGFYLGCNNNSDGTSGCVFRDSIIEHNYIHDIDGEPGVGDGIQIKDGSYNNRIRDNVVHTSGPGGAVGIQVYGTDGNAPNIIERNVIWQVGDHGIQASSEVIIRNNIIFSAALNGIQISDHQSAIAGNLSIVNNTVISDNTPLSIYAPDGLGGTILVANNAFYATGDNQGIRLTAPSGDLKVVGNVGVGSSSPSLSKEAWNSTGNLLTDFGNIQLMDAFPVNGSKLIGSGDPSYQPDDDFNSSVRGTRADVGAYVFEASGNPGWKIAPAFKEIMDASLPGDLEGNQE